MSKKLITAGLALVALAAFVLPAAASASPVLTHPTGTKLATGTKITGTNVGETLLTTGETVLARCTTVVVTGELTTNSGTQIEGTITTATFSGTGAKTTMNECTSSFGNITVTTNGGGVDGENVENGTPWCLKSGASDTFTLRGNACNKESRKITFTLDSTTAGECKYERTTALSGTFTTDTAGSDALLSLASGASTEFVKESGGFLCPSKGGLQMTFTLETDSEAVSPLYIS